MNPSVQLIGEMVAAMRTASSLSKSSLAHRAGVHRNYIAQIEGGQANPSINLLARLASACGYSLHVTLREVKDA